MIRTAVYFAMVLFGSTAAVAQTASPESQMTQTMLAEIRQLRLDIQTAAATIQRVQIGMFRLQVQGAQFARAKERLEQARGQWKNVLSQRKILSSEAEQAEAWKRNAKNSSDQQRAEQMFSRIQSEAASLTTLEQEYRAEEADAEAHFRTEEGKMNDLQDRLDRLDRILASYGQK